MDRLHPGALPMVVVILLFLMPFYEKLLGKRSGFALAIILTTGGITTAGWLTWSGYQHDRDDLEFQRLRRRELDYAGRAVWLAGKNGIPPEGPVTLLQGDAKAMGPLLFATNCATCHRWNGFDGTGKIVTEIQDKVRVPAKASASDLYQFASRKWIAEFLANPADERFFGHMGNKKGGEKIRNGSMTKWAKENVGADNALQQSQLNAVAALLAREAHRHEEPQPNAAELQLGIAIFSGSFSPPEGKELAHCLQCHDLKAGDPDKTGSEGIALGPNLNGYGSREWLMAFIRNPGEKRFYGARNVMPAFDKSRLSDRELGMLVDWMRGEWQREQTATEPDRDLVEDPADAPDNGKPDAK